MPCLAPQSGCAGLGAFAGAGRGAVVVGVVQGAGEGAVWCAQAGCSRCLLGDGEGVVLGADQEASCWVRPLPVLMCSAAFFVAVL